VISHASSPAAKIQLFRSLFRGRTDVYPVRFENRKTVDDRVGAYGHLVVDECHHLSARSFELVARRAKAKFVTGLSATVLPSKLQYLHVHEAQKPINHKKGLEQAPSSVNPQALNGVFW